MRKSTRFAAAVHILTMLAAIEEEYLSSDVIARSMNTNRVVVRRLIASLAHRHRCDQANVRGQR